jgi:hypothetical protein
VVVVWVGRVVEVVGPVVGPVVDGPDDAVGTVVSVPIDGLGGSVEVEDGPGFSVVPGGAVVGVPALTGTVMVATGVVRTWR